MIQIQLLLQYQIFLLILCGYEAVIFHNFSYDLNDILTNDTFKNIHTIYLTVVDIILWFGVVFLASKCINNVIGGMGNAVSDNIETSDSALDEKAYENYARRERAKSRYNREGGSK